MSLHPNVSFDTGCCLTSFLYLEYLTLNIHLYILLNMDTTILIKTKKDIKLKAQKLAKELGLSLADVVNASLRQFIINQGITISKLPTESLNFYSNKKEILSAYKNSFKEF